MEGYENENWRFGQEDSDNGGQPGESDAYAAETGGQPGTYGEGRPAQAGAYAAETDAQAGAYAYGQPQDAGGFGETDGWYRPYEEAQKPPKKGGGFFTKLMKFSAIAVTCGLAAGLAFAGSARFFGIVTGSGTKMQQDAASLSGERLYIAESTESTEIADPVASQTESGKTEPSYGAVTDVSDIAEGAMPSIVSITTIARMRTQSFFFGQGREYESEGCGSGIIVSQDEEFLYIATNNHVVEGAETLTVLFSDDSSVSARIKGTDPSTDLAVVSVALADIGDETKKAIRMAVFGDSSSLKMGQAAVAIGNALGYGQSVTTGVVSALDRDVTVTNEADGGTITNALIQTSAAINPGNSGGALLNLNGEVIGITSVKYSETSVEGMGYAIPTKLAVPIIRQLITREIVKRSEEAYLGISAVDVTESVSGTYQMPKGVYVARVVEGSSAEAAGIKQGDIITRFDGRNITSEEEMQELMKYLPAGSEVEVTIQRAYNGEYKEETLKIVLGTKK